jgi:hypothetical protein
MLTAIRPSRRRKTPLARLTAALPAVPHRHRRRHLHAASGAIVGPVVLALIIGVTAVIFRDKLASIVSGADEAAEQAPDAGEE